MGLFTRYLKKSEEIKGTEREFQQDVVLLRRPTTLFWDKKAEN